MVGSLSALSRAAGAAPVVLRVVIGVVEVAHGWQKLTVMGPANFGGDMLAGLVAVLLLGPGRPSLDHLLSIEGTVPSQQPATSVR